MALNPLIDEKGLLQRLREDDHVAFTHLYQHYWKPMLLVAWNHTKDKVLAEDLVHEVFMTLWEKRHLQQIESVAGFLTTAVKFSVFKHYQKQKHRAALAQQNLSYSESSDEEAKWDALFLQEYLAGIIEQLPEKCRLVFEYSRTQGLKNAEIAKLLNISEKGVEANLTRALKLIKQRIDKGTLLLLVSSELIEKIRF